MSQSKTQGQSKSKSQSKSATAARRTSHKRSAGWEEKLARIAKKFAQTSYEVEGKHLVAFRERLEWTRSYSVTLTGGDLMFLYAFLGEMAETHSMSDAERRELANSAPWKFGAANVQAFLGEAMRLREDAVESIDYDRRKVLCRKLQRDARAKE